MADNTKIEWTEATWNPITGCSVHSPGCTNCYAMQLAGTRLAHHPSRAGLTRDSKAGPVWTGEVRFNEQWLTQPLRWKRPRLIFVCAHGDLFHESVPDEWIDRVFAVMALAPQHTFQVLTKRSARMREYVSSLPTRDDLVGQACLLTGGFPSDADKVMKAVRTPLPNVWLGVSVEDQTRADERIPDLLATPAAVRWLSCEPLLGPVDLNSNLGGTLWIGGQRGCGGQHHGIGTPDCPRELHHHHDDRCDRGIDWVVCGGESGPNARPMHPAWARSLRDQCQAAGVPFFFKQWGEWFPYGEIDADGHQNSRTMGEKPWNWREWSNPTAFSVRIGKKQAGRLLDGVEHNGYPEVRNG